MTESKAPVPGSCYKFTVKSADEAASIIREKLGPRAHVLSVRTVDAPGLRRFWSSPSLEVIAQIEPDTDASEATPNEATERENENDFVRAAKSGTPSLPTLLRRAGLSDIALARLQEDPQWAALLEMPVYQALVEVGVSLKRQADARSIRRPLSRAAFLGTAGSGRTTALCKWLGVEVFSSGRSGSVVMAEFDRPNPVGPLPMFCEAMGVPCGRFPTFAGQPSSEGGFVYFDMPSISLRDPSDNAELLRFMDRERIEQRVLVLNLAYDHATLRAAYAEGRALGSTHVVFTHLDEVQQWGRLWEYLSDGFLDPLFLGTGPALTGDCVADVFGAVIRRTLASTGSSDGPDGETAPAPLRKSSRKAHA